MATKKTTNGNGTHHIVKHLQEKSHEEHTHTKRTTAVRLYRSETNRVLGGVCGGLGESLGIDPVIVRLFFIVFTFMGGSGFLIYLILWVILPPESQIATGNQAIRENIHELKEKARSISLSLGGEESRSWIGLVLLSLGIIYLLNSFGLTTVDFSKLWPMILIILGFILLSRRP